MPLQDHFRPPLSARRHWHAFYNAWATYLASDLNRRLPQGYFAEANVQFGIEIDVAAFEEEGAPAVDDTGWSPPPPALTLPFTLAADTVEIQVFSSQEGPTLAGAIELVSPANKDRPAHCNAFVSKCETYLRHGVGLVVVDVVTERTANLHNELLARVGGDESRTPGSRPVRSLIPTRETGWTDEPGHLAGSPGRGRALPTMPLWLRSGLGLPVDLDATYERTCREQRVTVNGI